MAMPSADHAQRKTACSSLQISRSVAGLQASELALVQQLLGGCGPRPEEAIIFQNVIAHRSIPTIAHR